MEVSEIKREVISRQVILAEHPVYRQQIKDHLLSLAAGVKYAEGPDLELYQMEFTSNLEFWAMYAGTSDEEIEEIVGLSRRSSFEVLALRPFDELRAQGPRTDIAVLDKSSAAGGIIITSDTISFTDSMAQL